MRADTGHLEWLKDTLSGNTVCRKRGAAAGYTNCYIAGGRLKPQHILTHQLVETVTTGRDEKIDGDKKAVNLLLIFIFYFVHVSNFYVCFFYIS
jgi:hypothetical protein